MNTATRSYYLVSMLAAALVAACNGGGSGSGANGSGINPGITVAPAAHMRIAQAMNAADQRKHKGKGKLRITIKIPLKLWKVEPLPVGGAQSQRRNHPKYISPSTQSMTVATSAGAPTQTFNLTTGSSHCSVDSDTGDLTCTESAFFPAGAQTITITLYDGQNGTGSALSSGSTSTTIVAGQVNTISVTLDGIVATATVQIDNAASVNIPEGTPTSLPVEVSAYDADDNLVLAPGHYASTTPVTLSDSDTSGVTTLSSSSVSAPGSSITLSYNGGSLSSATITVKVNGVAQANPATLNVGPPPSPQASPASLSFSTAASQSFVVSESGYSGTFTESDTCSGIASVSPSSGTGPSATFTVTPVGGGTCAVTVSDSNNKSASVSVLVNGGVIIIDETPVATPTSLTFDTAASQTFGVKEKSYTGLFSESDTCSGIASTSPSSASGPNATFTVTPVDGGSCTITVSDNQANTASVSISVSGGAITINAKHGKQTQGGN